MAQELEIEKRISDFNRIFGDVEKEVGRVIVGMSEVVRLATIGIFAGGHVLLEGVPGLGKTLLVKTIASTLGLSFKRVQFTPDLMPSDVTGTQVMADDGSGGRKFVFRPGPLFSQIVLADEINRATPKTQSALLEAMEERQVTVFDETHRLPQPFFVLATQNPIELEGTYPLPEAQLDRFMVKVIVNSPNAAQLKEILARTTGDKQSGVTPVFDSATAVVTIASMRDLVRKVVVSDGMLEVLVRMIGALTPTGQYTPEKIKKYVRFGPGPRGAQATLLVAKTLALLDGRINLALEDIREAIVPALRHRIILNFQAEADGVTTDQILRDIKNAK